MKKKIILKYIVMLIVLLFIIENSIFAQGNNGQGRPWKKNQATGNIYNTGLTNYVGIGTDNPLYPLDVKGQILTDSMRVISKLHIGPSSLSLAGAPPGGNDEITSTNGVINLGGNPIFSTIQVGIGTQTPFATLPTVYGLEVNNDINLTSSVPNHGYRIGGVVVLQTPVLRKYFVHII